MKTTTYALFALLLGVSLSVKAQISNADLETWITYGNPPTDYEDPENWKSVNGMVAFGTTPVDKSTDRYSGTYAAEIKPFAVFGSFPPSVLCLGNPPADFSTYTLDILHGGKPVSSRPASVSGYYKYSKDAVYKDSAYAIVILKKYNSTLAKIDTIGLGYTTFSEAASYSPFSITINYNPLSSLTPDSIVIAFFSQATESGFAPATGKLLIDKLSIGGASSSKETEAAKPALQVYPNPARHSIYFEAAGLEENTRLEVYDLLGRLVRTEYPDQSAWYFNRENLPAGTYLYRLSRNEENLDAGKMIFID